MTDALAQEQKTESPKGRIFISYAHGDEAFAFMLKDLLHEAGRDVWIDQEKLSAGDEWRREIQDELLAASEVFVVWSPDADKSKWVPREVAFADEQKKRVVPVICRDCPIPFYMSHLQRVDFTSPGKYKEGLEKLLRGPVTVKRRWWYLGFLTWRGMASLLATLAGLVALALYLPYRLSPSDTSSTVAATNDANVVALQLQNRGGRASTIMGGYRLEFEGLPIVDKSLDLVEAPPDELSGHSTKTILLKTRSGFEPKKLPDGSYRNDEQIERLLPGHDVILEVDVRESGDAPGKPHTRSTRLPATRIGKFIKTHLPHFVPGVDHAN